MFKNEESAKLAKQQGVYIVIMIVGLFLSFFGIVTLFINAFSGFTFNAPLIILTILLLIFGPILGIFGLIEVNKYQKEIEENNNKLLQPFAQNIFKSFFGDSISSSSESVSLKCPDCGAPLESRPPCKCSYCGRIIE